MNDDMFLEAEIINDLIDEGRPVTTTDDKIRAAIKVECDRQHVGEDRQVMLYDTYKLVQSRAYLPLNRGLIKLFAAFIEPDNNGQFRTTPVSFNGIVGGVPPENIERAMERWLPWLNERVVSVKEEPELAEWYAEPVIKEFLDIHPFSDGNGRTAWLLRVWMLNQWDNPQPLPDYYKKV